MAGVIAVREPCVYTRMRVAERNDDIVLVAERHLERAVSLLLQIAKTVVEGAGAAGLAAMLAHPDAFAGRTVGLVLTGGNIHTRLLPHVLLRDPPRSGRISRLLIRLPAPPGALLQGTTLFNGTHGQHYQLNQQSPSTTHPP